MIKLQNPIDNVKTVSFDVFNDESTHRKAILNGINAIIYDIVLYLFTMQGDKLFNQNFGGNLYSALFDFDSVAYEIVSTNLAAKLKDIEDRISIYNISLKKLADHVYILEIYANDPSDIDRVIKYEIDVNSLFHK